jgi:sugar phosphate isomerase/epimerase
MTRDCTISCRLEVLPGVRVIDKLHQARAFGFDGVSVPGRFLAELLDELRACLPDSPLPLLAMSLGFTGSLLSPQAEVRRRCRESFLRLFDICAELAIANLNVPPVLNQDNPQRITNAGAYDSITAAQDALLLDQLPELAEQARQRGVVFLLEPVNRYESDYLNTLQHAARLCQALDRENVGCTADFFHMQLEELDSAAAIRCAGKWIKLVHVAENTRVEAGPGSLNFLPGFRALQEMHYSGVIELECRALSGPAELVLPRSVEYLRRCWSVGLSE